MAHLWQSVAVSLCRLSKLAENALKIEALAAHKYIIKYFINVWYTYGILYSSISAIEQ